MYGINNLKVAPNVVIKEDHLVIIVEFLLLAAENDQFLV